MRDLRFNATVCIFLLLVAMFYWYEASASTDHYLVREEQLGNGYKLCIYDGDITITVRSHDLCPLRIRE